MLDLSIRLYFLLIDVLKSIFFEPNLCESLVSDTWQIEIKRFLWKPKFLNGSSPLPFLYVVVRCYFFTVNC